MITLRTLLLRMIADLADGYDIVILIDGNDDNRHGPVGAGKTNLGLWLAYAIAQILQKAAEAAGLGDVFSFDVETDAIIRDDLKAFKIAVKDRRFGRIVFVDEAEWFFFNEWHAYKEVRALTPEFMSNRKEGRVWILLIPTIWKMQDFMRETRIQWRIRMETRYTATIFVRSAARKNLPKKDVWGIGLTQVREVLRFPLGIWYRYEDLIDAHVCDERGKTECVVNLREKG